MKKSINSISLIFLVFSMIFISGCGGKKDEVKSEVDTEYLTSVMEGIEYETIEVRNGSITEKIEEKYLKMAPINIEDIVGKSSGIVKKYYFPPHSLIYKGELIAEIESQEINQQISIQKDKIDIEKIIYDRMKGNSNSRELKVQELQVRIEAEKLKALHTLKENSKIYAPTDCSIKAIYKGELNQFNKGDKLFKIERLDNFIVKSAKRVNMIKFENTTVGQRVVIMTNAGSTIGEIRYSSPKVGLIIDPNFEEIKGDLFTKDKKVFSREAVVAHFEEKELHNKTIIAEECIRTNNGMKYVEILKDGIKKKRFVNLGAFGIDKNEIPSYEVLSGLNEGEIVILKKLTIFDKLNKK